MKKTFLALAVALLLVLTLTACTPEPAGLTVEDNENLIRYMSRILSATYQCKFDCEWDSTTVTDIDSYLCFETGSMSYTSDSDSVTMTFKNAKMTSETDFTTGSVTIDDDGNFSFTDLVFYCKGTKYTVSGTATPINESLLKLGIAADYYQVSLTGEPCGEVSFIVYVFSAK